MVVTFIGQYAGDSTPKVGFSKSLDGNDLR